MSAGDENLKDKYLRQAHHRIQRDTRGSKRKLKASIEPLSRGGRHNGNERGGSGSDICSDTLSHRNSFTHLPPMDHHNLSSSPQSSAQILSSTPRGGLNHSSRTPHSAPAMRHTNHTPNVPTDTNNITTDSIVELESQLQTQRVVNKELKRLLVASVGSDLELRLEQIVREKTELSQDLSLSLQQVLNHHEELDQISIECDIWRSKFIASRVMIDELASWKAELSLRLRECQKALQYMLHEREDISRELVECHTHLQKARDGARLRPQSNAITYLGASNVATVSPIQYGTTGSLVEEGGPLTVLELARGNTVATRNLATQLCRWNQTDTVSNSAQPAVKPTAGERLARRAMNSRGIVQRGTTETTPQIPKFLVSDEDLIHCRSSVSTATGSGGGGGGGGGHSSLSPLSRRLFHFGARALEDPFRLPFHCAKCQGKIIVV